MSRRLSGATHRAVQVYQKVERQRERLFRDEEELADLVKEIPKRERARYVELTAQRTEK